MLSRQPGSRGFTIVELLIVIVIIAILAAIVIVAFNGVQGRARESEVKAGVSQGKKKLQLFQVDNGCYPATGNLAAAGVTNGSVTYQYTQTGGCSGFCLTGTKSGTAFNATQGTAPTLGTCTGHGADGLPAGPTNLIANPSFETDTSGWTSQNATLTRVTSGSGIVSGSAAMQFTSTTNGTIGGYASTTTTVTGLTPSTTYTASASIYVTAWGNANTVFISSSANGDGGGCATIGSNEINTPTTSARVSCTFTTSSSASATGTFIVRGYTDECVGLIFRVDGVMVEASSTLNAYHN